MSDATGGTVSAPRTGAPRKAAVELSGGTGLTLDGSGHGWMVDAGPVEIYYRGRDEATCDGPRRFLFTLERGDLVPPLDAAAAHLRVTFFALGDGAVLRPVAAPSLSLLLRDHSAEGGDRLLARWLELLAGRLPPGPGSVRQVPLPPDTTVALPPDEPARPESGICWVEREHGTCRVRGRAELELAAGEAVPLSPSLWLTADGAAPAVRTWSTAQLPADHDPFGLLHAFTQRLLSLIAAHDRSVAAAEAERLHASDERDAALLGRSYELLGGVLDGRRSATTRGAGVLSHLLQACRIVGAELGLDIREPPDAARGSVSMRDPVDAIARASKARVRKVILRGAWWTRDNGPLLAFVEEGGRPVALIQPRPTRYAVHDPAEGTVRPVTAEVAATLRPIAHMFFPSFGDVKLTPVALWKMGMRGVGGDLRMVLLLSAAAGLLALTTPYLSQILFDDIVPQASRGQLPVIGIVLITFALVGATLGLVRIFVLLRMEARMELNMEAAMMDRLLRLPATFFKQYLAGDLAQRVMGITSIRAALTGTVLSAILSGVFSVISLGLVIYYDAKLAVLAVILALIALGVILASSLVALRYNRKLAAWAGEIAGLVLQLMTSVAKLRVAAAERRAFAVWAEKFAQQRRHAFDAGAVQNNFQIFRSAYPLLTSMLFFGVIYAVTEASFDQQSTLTTGAFIAVIAAFGQFLGGMLGLGGAVISVLQVIPQYERMQPILEAEPETGADRADPGRLSGAVEIGHVSFRYAHDGPVILNEVSLHAEPGEMVALVGPSGSGKSTLIRLLLGFEQPASGTILYDGKDLGGLDLSAVRQQFGVVLQHGQLVQGDIFSNIIGPWDLTLDDAWTAATMVGLDEDIKAMPMGMHTLVSEDSGTFSGGQRQRLLIARAIVHQPAVLLLDEATSALDNRTQKIVSESLKRLQVTRIVIAHRLSTIMEADRIYVLDGGRIVESGTYQSLLDEGGHFAALAERQLL